LAGCRSGFLKTLLVTDPSVTQVACTAEIVMLCYNGFWKENKNTACTSCSYSGEDSLSGCREGNGM